MAIALVIGSSHGSIRGSFFRQVVQALHHVALQQGKHLSMWFKATPRSTFFVGNLTATPIWRRLLVSCRPTAVLVALSAILMPSLVHSDSNTPQWQPIEQIAAAAEDFLLGRTGVFAGNTTVRAGTLDARHRLAYCDKPLDGFLRSGTDIKARTIVGVRCSGSKPWKVYVPVDVVVTANVLVARQTLIKGQVLAATDLTVEQRDVSRVRGGYLSEPKQVVGRRLKTQVIAGKTLKPTMIEVDIAIRRGQSVTLTVNSGGFDINMKGTAMMDGAVNQRIRVRNTNSGRIIEGIVRSREHVEVLLSKAGHFSSAGTKVSPTVADTGYSNNDR